MRHYALALALATATACGSSNPAGPPCDGTCGNGAACVNATCQCLEGFTGDGITCTAEQPSTDLANRSKADVCSHWKAGHVVTATAQFTPVSSDPCDPGVMTGEAIVDASTRWNMYRWLVGLPAASVNTMNAADMQQCGLMLGYAFRHDPPPSTMCYTPGGADAAGRSMICSVGNATTCMDLYTLESYATDNRLSHRKIVVGTNRNNVNFGATRNGSCALYATGEAPATVPAFIAIPNPGPTPMEMTRSTWSIHQTTDPLPIADAKVFDETAGTDVVVKQNLKYAGINGFDLMTPIVTDHTYRVTLSDGSTTVEYRTTPVACAR